MSVLFTVLAFSGDLIFIYICVYFLGYVLYEYDVYNQ